LVLNKAGTTAQKEAKIKHKKRAEGAGMIIPKTIRTEHTINNVFEDSGLSKADPFFDFFLYSITALRRVVKKSSVLSQVIPSGRWLPIIKKERQAMKYLSRKNIYKTVLILSPGKQQHQRNAGQL